MYYTNISPFTYTGSENANITYNQISLTGVYTKTDVDDIDNELPTLILNTCAKTETQATHFDKHQVFENIESNYYDKVTMDSLLANQYINFTNS